MKLALGLLAIVVGTLLTVQIMVRWERPPMVSEQLGPRGLGMEQITNPRTQKALIELNQPPAPLDPATPSGTKASETYLNVQVLGDLDTEEFNRFMGAITEWVAPEQGCNYCHNPEKMEEDSVYTKVVARRMIQMTRAINTAWTPHVKQTGVTCYTCHRGHPVPQNVWYRSPGPAQAKGMSADRQGQNLAAKLVGSTSLPYDPFTDLFAKDANIRVISQTALPQGHGPSIKKAEETYALMMYISHSLGVNCTYCHNSRSFTDWTESRPQRVTAWDGIKMVSNLNADYLQPLKDVFPANRKGPTGDVANVGCATCHQGVIKPLFGASMVKDYPELLVPNPNP